MLWIKNEILRVLMSVVEKGCRQATLEGKKKTEEGDVGDVPVSYLSST